jgi:hypothetical protein
MNYKYIRYSLIAYGEEPNLNWGTRGRGFESRHSHHSSQLAQRLRRRAPLPFQLATGLFPRAEAIAASNSSSRSIVTGFTRW